MCYYNYIMERMLVGEQDRCQIGSVFIFDLAGLCMKHVSRETILSFIEVLSQGQRYYPEAIYKMVIVNAPSIFWIAWGIIQVFLPPRTKSKISIHTDNANEYLTQLIGHEALPRHLGGAGIDVSSSEFAVRCGKGFLHRVIPVATTITVTTRIVAGEGSPNLQYAFSVEGYGCSVNIWHANGGRKLIKALVVTYPGVVLRGVCPNLSLGEYEVEFVNNSSYYGEEKVCHRLYPPHLPPPSSPHHLTPPTYIRYGFGFSREMTTESYRKRRRSGVFGVNKGSGDTRRVPTRGLGRDQAMPCRGNGPVSGESPLSRR